MHQDIILNEAQAMMIAECLENYIGYVSNDIKAYQKNASDCADYKSDGLSNQLIQKCQQDITRSEQLRDALQRQL